MEVTIVPRRKPFTMVLRFSVVLLSASFFSHINPGSSSSLHDVFDPSLTNTASTIQVGNPPKEIVLDKYFNSSELAALLDKLRDEYGHIVKVTSIGESALDRASIWAVQISRNVQKERELLKPQFKFVANIHGDEAVGYALMVSLMQYLAYSDGSDPRISNMLDTTDIWIVPTVNPDGLRRAVEGRCESLDDLEGKYNGRRADLDQNFENEFFYDARPRELETWNIVDLLYRQSFVLSGNLQGGGAIVANYPFDFANSSLESYTPDHDLFVDLAAGYARSNSMMAPGTACNKSFPGGIANGNFWRKNGGSMQDYNYQYSSCLEITLFLSCCKYPPTSQLPLFWTVNLESLLSLVERTRRGVYGLVRDRDDKPVRRAVIQVEGNGKEILASENGEYWRLLLPGFYTLTVRAFGYRNQQATANVTVEKPYVRLDFVLSPQGVHGLIKDRTGRPIGEAVIAVNRKPKWKEPLRDAAFRVFYGGWPNPKMPKEVRVSGNGTFKCPLDVGTHVFRVRADGFRNVTRTLSVTHQRPYVRSDFVLKRIGEGCLGR